VRRAGPAARSADTRDGRRRSRSGKRAGWPRSWSGGCSPAVLWCSASSWRAASSGATGWLEFSRSRCDRWMRAEPSGGPSNLERGLGGGGSEDTISSRYRASRSGRFAFHFSDHRGGGPPPYDAPEMGTDVRGSAAFPGLARDPVTARPDLRASPPWPGPGGSRPHPHPPGGAGRGPGERPDRLGACLWACGGRIAISELAAALASRPGPSGSSWPAWRPGWAPAASP